MLTTLLVAAAPLATSHAQSVPIDHDAVRATRIVTATRITDGITLDGHLDEPAWTQAQVAGDFIQKFPNNGAPSTERTEFRVLYDENYLYVGFWCFDSDPSTLLIKDLKEDFEFNTTDLVQVFIDSLHDKRSGFAFSVNPAGARRDTQISSGATTNQDWDGVWDAKVSRDERGWYVEYAIPFKTLRFSSARSQVWGLNASRKILHKNEETHWAPVPVRYSGTRSDQAGTLRGLENIRQGRNLKIKPFVLGSATGARTPAGTQNTHHADGGFDLKYSLTPSLTLDSTYRTDFAQVEVDQQQVNLTRFNLFFPEKRDFFLENSGTFTFGAARSVSGSNLLPFFSRRIGLSPAGTPIPIVGGARVSGKVNRYDVGLIAMRTEPLGTRPSNTYLVGRVKRNIRNTSWVGAIVTDRQSAGAGDYNRVYGPDLHLQLHNKLEIDSYVLRSDTPGKTSRNLARQLKSAWIDDELSVSAEYSDVEPNFNPEVGFVRRGDMSLYSGEVIWSPRLERSETIRNLTVGGNIDYYRNGAGRLETRTQEGTFGVTFEDTGSVTFKVTDTFDRLVKPFALRPAVAIPAGDYQYRRYAANLATGARRKVGVTAGAEWGEFWDGTNASLTGGLGMRPNYHLSIDLNYSRSQVDVPRGAFTTQLVGARLLYGLSPRALVNAFIQYNTDTHQVSSNVRFNFTHHPLSDLYVVYNDRRDSSTGQLVDRALIIKLTNLFTF